MWPKFRGNRIRFTEDCETTNTMVTKSIYKYSYFSIKCFFAIFTLYFILTVSIFFNHRKILHTTREEISNLVLLTDTKYNIIEPNYLVYKYNKYNNMEVLFKTTVYLLLDQKLSASSLKVTWPVMFTSADIIHWTKYIFIKWISKVRL